MGRLLTEEDLRRFAPRALPGYVEALLSGQQEIEACGLDTPLRLTHFLAQTAHETNGYTIVTENLRYTAKRIREVWPSRFAGAAGAARAMLCANKPERLAEAVYGGRMGNTERGDGYAYRGCGFLQTTGRDNYRRIGDLLGVDLERDPQLLENPAISLRAALAEWQEQRLNRFADRNYLRAIGNAINRGNAYSKYPPIGEASRRQWWERAWAVWGDGKLPSSAEIALGATGAAVEALQRRLRELGYAVGAADGVFGSAVADAVVAFKARARRTGLGELEPDEIVGARTQAALDRGVPREVSPERAAATIADVVRAGSTEVSAGRATQGAGTALAAAGAVEGARQTGLLDTLRDNVGWLPELQLTLAPVLDALRWAWSHAFWAIALVLGVWAWSKGRHVVLARWRAYVEGLNMSK
jgi:putative chitinase